MTLTITLQHPRNAPNGSNPLGRQAAIRANYASMAAKKLERHDGYMVALYELRKAEAAKAAELRCARDNERCRIQFEPKRYRIVWYYRGVRPDADNVVARCKHVLDGCAAAFGVNDATWELGKVQRVHDLEKGGSVDIIFSDDENE